MLNIENNPQKDVTRTNLQCDISDFADINREFSEKHAGAVVAGELTKPSGCALH